ncbi:sensor histidine kinase [Glaciibacter sp. 2TAF33]|uniref:sensor histidine kinase n=1 Tax=Glaciibacter sp. 2TAF33 TaxID=3233015 RepID=UPI003F917833
MSVTVVVLAVAVTGAIAFPLIRSAGVEQARNLLSQAADEFSALRPSSFALDRRQQRLLDRGDYSFTLIGPNGVVSGGTSTPLTTRQVNRVLAGDSVSTTVSTGGTRVLVEARPTRSGGAIVLSRGLDTVYAASGQTVARLALALGIGFALAILIGTSLARRIARPLVVAAAAARKLAAGERSVGLPESSVTEVAEVSKALATLDTALSTSEGRQREFLLSISHDIRSPLTALRGYGEALADGLVDQSELRHVGETLAAETERLNRFVTDLLELARLGADDFQLHPTRLDFAGLAGEVERAWTAQCAQNGIRLSTERPSHPVIARADPQRVRQILDNLLDNAVRATPAGSPIVIAVRESGPDAIVEVRDSGPGLSAGDRSVAFDRGALYERYRDVRAVGSGLGLSIAARLATRMGGMLLVDAAPEGGACFRLELPRGEADRGPTRPG